MFVEEAGDVVAAEVEPLDAGVYVRDGPGRAPREVRRQGAQRSYAATELASPLLQVDAQELHHLARDGVIEAPERCLSVSQTQHALEVHQALVHAHSQKRPLAVDGEVLESV